MMMMMMIPRKALYPTTNKKSRVQSMRLFCGLISQILHKPSPAIHGLVNG